MPPRLRARSATSFGFAPYPTLSPRFQARSCCGAAARTAWNASRFGWMSEKSIARISALHSRWCFASKLNWRVCFCSTACANEPSLRQNRSDPRLRLHPSFGQRSFCTRYRGIAHLPDILGICANYRLDHLLHGFAVHQQRPPAAYLSRIERAEYCTQSSAFCR